MITGFLQAWGRTLILMALVAVICVPTSYCSGIKHANQQRDAELALANKIAQDRAITVIDQAANERVADAITEAKSETALTAAVSATPDTAPDAIRVQLGCERLRQQGVAIDAISACTPAP